MRNQPAIRNIIFDYGGVIVDLHPQRTETAFSELGIVDFNRHFNILKQTTLFDKLETGKVTASEFRNELNLALHANFTNQQIDNAWNAMLGGIRKEKFDLLQEVKSNYRTFLLSNTNCIHLEKLTGYLLETHGRHDLNAFFEKVYFSFLVGLRKPDAAIFLKVIHDNKLSPMETLFIDDSPQHVAGAKAVGLQALLFPAGDDLRLFLSKHL
jgi:FMN phosphatase YigB (HAD superfamily)